MSVIAEAVLQRALVSGIQAIRNDTRVLHILFKQLTQRQIQSLESFFSNTAINLSVNYPRGEIPLPSIILLLQSEGETNPLLGDQLDEGSLDILGGDEAFGSNTVGSTTGMSGHPTLLAENLAVASVTGNKITLASGSIPGFQLLTSRYDILDTEVVVIAGAGKGQTKNITAFSQNSLDTDTVFSVNLDNTSILDIRTKGVCSSVGEPTQVFDTSGNYRRIGSIYKAQYQVNILAGKQEQVIYLYSIVKAILFSQRSLLEREGLQNLEISGSDLAPRSEYNPDEVFQRVMTLSFTYPFSFLESFEVDYTSIDFSFDLGNPFTAEQDTSDEDVSSSNPL